MQLCPFNTNSRAKLWPKFEMLNIDCELMSCPGLLIMPKRHKCLTVSIANHNDSQMCWLKYKLYFFDHTLLTSSRENSRHTSLYHPYERVPPGGTASAALAWCAARFTDSKDKVLSPLLSRWVAWSALCTWGTAGRDGNGNTATDSCSVVLV